MTIHQTLRAVLCLAALCPAALSAATATVSPGQSIQAALDAVGNAGGGTVYVQPGNYDITTSLKVPNNTRLKGVTTRPVITMAANADKPVILPKTVPFTAVTCDFLSLNGGLTNAQMDAGTYWNAVGVQFGGGNNGTAGYIYNCNMTNCTAGVVMGYVTDGLMQGVNITNCGCTGTTSPGMHNVYISNTDPFRASYCSSTYCRTGMGFKITDFYGDRTETSQVVDHCNFSNNQGGRGTAIYDISPIVFRNNTCDNNTQSGINMIRCGNVTLTDNHATGNPNQANVSYDIWLNSCTATTISGNVYGSKRGF